MTTAASAVRHTVGAAFEALLIAAIVAALAFGIALANGHPFGAQSVLAANGGGQSGATSWISLSQVNGLAAASTQPSLGSTVSFATGYPSNVKNPRIEVLCYQGGSLVYGAAGGVTDSFLLGGGGSIWLYSGGGPADCTANLFYFGMHAGSQTYNWLASTSFAAGG